MGCSEWCREEFRPSNFGLGHSRPHLTVTAQWDGFPPLLYVIWRWFAACYHLAWLIVSVAAATIYVAGKATWFAYLTNWTYFLLTLDLFVEAVASLMWYIRQRNPNNVTPQSTTWYMKMAWLMYEMSSSVALMVGIVYWVLLYRPNSQDFYIDLQTHGITILYVVVNLVITGMPVRIYHVIYPFLFAILYVVFTVIYYHAGGVEKNGYRYIYREILDWNDPNTSLTWISVLSLVGLPVIHLLIVYCGFLVRVVVYKKCCNGKVKNDDRFEMTNYEKSSGDERESV